MKKVFVCTILTHATPTFSVYLEGPAAIIQFCERLLHAQLAGSRLDLSQMQLTQIHIPAERCIVSGSITMLNLDANCFSEVPSCMAQFTSLQASLPPLECRSVFLRAVKRNHRDCCTGAQREEESADCPSRVSELHQVITGSLWVVAFVYICAF